MSHYDTNLDKNEANYIPLTPLTFLKRAKDIYPDYEAVIYDDRKYSWSEVYKRTVKFASALTKIGVKKGDTVSFLAFNTTEILKRRYKKIVISPGPGTPNKAGNCIKIVKNSEK